MRAGLCSLARASSAPACFAQHGPDERGCCASAASDLPLSELYQRSGCLRTEMRAVRRGVWKRFEVGCFRCPNSRRRTTCISTTPGPLALLWPLEDLQKEGDRKIAADLLLKALDKASNVD